MNDSFKITNGYFLTADKKFREIFRNSAKWGELLNNSVESNNFESMANKFPQIDLPFIISKKCKEMLITNRVKLKRFAPRSRQIGIFYAVCTTNQDLLNNVIKKNHINSVRILKISSK